MLISKSQLNDLRDFLMIGIGTSLYAFGYTMFLLPYHLTSGGIGGVSAIVFYITGIEVQYSYAAINALFLLFALKILGWRFCLKTVYGVTMCTFWMWACQRIFEDSAGVLPQLCGDERFMAVLLGSMIEGLALALCFHFNGSTGGTDIVAACINKYKDISLGSVILGCDIFIISSCYFIFNDIQMVIFGYVLMAVAAFTLDYLTRYFHQAVEFKIFSRNYATIAEAIVNAGFGVTVLDGHGWYTKTERKVIVCIASKKYDKTIARIIKRVDPFAFLSVTNVEGVYGEGFARMKTKVKDMKPIIVFATNNKHKLEEVRDILSERFEVRSLSEIGCNVELPETHGTLEENALEKCAYINKYYGFDCFADDTGLEVEALEGAPGVYSARYANIPDPEYKDDMMDMSVDHDSQANMRKLLFKLKDKENRKARFRTSIALIYKGKSYDFEGIVNGEISKEKSGDGGFGYDPVFVPEGFDKSFAELGNDIKNKISHRALATEKLAEFLLKNAEH